MDGTKKAVFRVADVLRVNPEVVENDMVNLETLTEIFVEIGAPETGETLLLFAALPKKPTQDSSTGIHLKYFVKCVGLLLIKLSKELEAEEKQLQPCILSTEETKNFSCLTQFLVNFGILPYLESRIARKDVSSTTIHMFSCFSPRDKYFMLYETSCLMFEICDGCETLRTIVTKTCFNPVLSAFMQLCFSPTSARLLDITKRRECMSFVNKILQSWITKDRLVEEVLVLQGGFSEQTIPKWLRDKCGMMLTRILLEKDGVKTIILSLVMNLEGSEPRDPESWGQVVTLSSILSTLPSKGITPVEYCELACPQLLELLVSARKNVSESSQEVVKISVTTLHALHEKYETESLFFEKIICAPLLQCCRNNNSTSQPNLCEITEEKLSNCIENLHQICVTVGVVPDTLLSLLVMPYLKLFFLLLCDIQESSSYIKKILQRLLEALLKSVSRIKAASFIMSVFCDLKDAEDLEKSLKIPVDGLKFLTTENGGVIPVLNNVSDSSEVLLQQDTKVNILNEMILNSSVEGLPGEVLLLLLKNLCNPEKNVPSQLNDKKRILTPEDKAVLALKSNEERFITFGLLTSLCETIDPKNLLSDSTQILSFIKAMLESLDMNSDNSQESLKMCISVLGICLMSDLDSTEKEELNSIVCILEAVSSGEKIDTKTKELVSDVAIAIRTYGAVNRTSLDTFSEAMKEELRRFEKQKCKDLNPQKDDENFDVQSEENSATPNSRASADDGARSVTDSLHKKSALDDPMIKPDSVFEKSFEEALEEVFDFSPAIKGGSIRYLTKCVQRQLPIAVQKLDKLIDIFMECLDDTDSFVYLSAVQGLSVIANTGIENLVSKNLLDKVIAKFLSREGETSNSGLQIESKMKLGEILTRVIREMGDVAPHHASVLLPEFLKGASHSNPDMRASCLSNFAELAPMAPHFLNQIQHRIKDCLCGVSNSDSDDLVRRSAVYAIYQLVNKLGETIMDIFPDVIKDFYRNLKTLYQRDNDNSVQLHAQLALEELDKIMRETIFATPTLSKKITVLPM